MVRARRSSPSRIWHAPGVDHLALLVHDLVVLEDVLADLGVAGLDGVLGPLDGLGHHLGLDRHVVGQGPAHDPVMAPGGEQAHELVFEREEEPALARVALAAGATPQLVVDAAGLVALGAEHVEPAELADLVALGLALLLVLGEQLVVAGLRPRRTRGRARCARTSWAASSSGLPPSRMSTPRPAMLVATVTACSRPAWATICGLPGVLLGVEDVVRDAPPFEHRRQDLGLLDRGGADQHRLALVVALDDVLDDGLELGQLGLVDQVLLVGADHRHVGRDRHDRQVVGAGELGRLGLGGAGHPGQLVVEAEVVLEGDRRPGVVLLLDRDPLLGLDRLVEAVGPAPALEDAAGELVDDLHLAVGDDVVLVPLVQLLGLEGLGQLVHVVGRRPGRRGCRCRAARSTFSMPVLGRGDGPLLLVDLVVDVPRRATGRRRRTGSRAGPTPTTGPR